MALGKERASEMHSDPYSGVYSCSECQWERKKWMGWQKPRESEIHLVDLRAHSFQTMAELDLKVLLVFLED